MSRTRTPNEQESAAGGKASDFDERLGTKEAKRDPRGTMSCPICGDSGPHAHDRADVEQWATSQVARWGYVARLGPQEERPRVPEVEAMLAAALSEVRDYGKECPVCDSQSMCREDCIIRKALVRYESEARMAEATREPAGPDNEGTRKEVDSARRLSTSCSPEARPAGPLTARIRALEEVDSAPRSAPRSACAHGVSMTQACMTCLSRGDDPRGDNFRPRTDKATSTLQDVRRRLQAKVLACQSTYDSQRRIGLDEAVRLVDEMLTELPPDKAIQKDVKR